MQDVQIERARRIKPSHPECGISVVKIPFNLSKDDFVSVPDDEVDAAERFGLPRIEQAHEELVELMGAESASTAALIPPEEVIEGFVLIKSAENAYLLAPSQGSLSVSPCFCPSLSVCGLPPAGELGTRAG